MPQHDAIPVEGVLDPGTLKQLLDLDDGETGLIKEMYQLFVEDMPPRILAIETAIRDDRKEEMGDVAHAVKGAASTMGASRVRLVALALETLGRTGKGDESAESLLERLQTEYDRARGALENFIASRERAE